MEVISMIQIIGLICVISYLRAIHISLEKIREKLGKDKE